MRVTGAFSRLVRLPGVWVRKVRFGPDRVVLEVALRRRRLQCPRCEFSTAARKDTRPVHSVWRHLDLGVWRLEIHCRRRRLRCPRHGVLAEGVPFARHRSGFTRDFECLIAWLAARTDKSAICRLLRVDWDTVGRIVARVCADELDRDRLSALYDIGVDEVSWKRQHNYLTLVADHRAGKIVWGCPGAGEQAADQFFAELDPSSPRSAPPTADTAGTSLSARAHHAGEQPEPPVAERAGTLEAISLDMGPGYAASARWHAPQAVVCIDPYHVVQNANKALDEVRRAYWNELRQSGDQEAAKRFKDARWSLLKTPPNLTDKQAVTLRRIKAAGGEVARVHAQRSRPRHLRARPHTRRRRDPHRPTPIPPGPQPLGALHPPRQDHPQPPRRHPRRRSPGHQPRPHRSPQQQGPTHRPPRLRLPHRQGRLALVMLTCGPITLRLPHQPATATSP